MLGTKFYIARVAGEWSAYAFRHRSGTIFLIVLSINHRVMKHVIIIISSLLFVLSANIANAQSPAPISPSDSVRNPIRQGDPNPQTLPAQAQYTEGMVRIKPSQLPKGLKATLKDETYKGWNGGNFYRAKDGSGYLLEIQEPIKTRLYRFDKEGKRVAEEGAP